MFLYAQESSLLSPVSTEESDLSLMFHDTTEPHSDNLSLEPKNYELELSELKMIIKELRQPFPITTTEKTETKLDTDYNYKDWCVKEFSLLQLRQLLPELTKTFPYEFLPDEFYPDGPAATEENTNNGWLALSALEKSYDEVSDLCFNPELNDWQVLVNGKPFFWANGKILPEEHRENESMYSAFFGYVYTQRVFEVLPQEVEYYTSVFSNIHNDAVQKDEILDNRFFLTEIYGEITQEHIQSNLTEVLFLNTRVYVHRRISQALERVHIQLTKLKRQGSYASFFSNYATIYGFNWRPIEYSGRLSNHALGIAVDIMAKNYGKLNAYWYWESVVNKNWFLLKKSERWIPPDEIIHIFENEGFIWGGYWTLWDTMHFEFKPELKYMSEYGANPKDRFYTDADIALLDLERENEMREQPNSQLQKEETKE